VGWPAGKTGPSASRKPKGCGAACPLAPMVACRRLADHMAGIVAGRVVHPLDDRRRFMQVAHPHSLSTRIAWSHCFSYPSARAQGSH
jgi:hypothetical protein